MKQKYEIYIRESSITINNHLKPIEIVECKLMQFWATEGQSCRILFEDDKGMSTYYNWQDIIKIVRIN